MEKSLKTRLKIIFAIIAIPVCWQFWYTEIRTPSGPWRWQSISPDGNFSVTGYSAKGFSVFIPTAPGDGGSGPGIVVLRDNKTGKALKQSSIDAINAIDEDSVIWRDDAVATIGIGRWNLPRKEAEKP